jgi:hypothetical protein
MLRPHCVIQERLCRAILGLSVEHDLDIEPATRKVSSLPWQRLFDVLRWVTDRLQSRLSVQIPPAPPTSPLSAPAEGW